MTPFEIESDLRRHYLRLTLRGYWDEATFTRFAQSFESALNNFKRNGGLKGTLVDGRDFAVQSTQISQKFGELIERCRPMLSPRTANVVPAMLNRMQADRAGADGARFFAEVADAERWLFEDDTTGP